MRDGRGGQGSHCRPVFGPVALPFLLRLAAAPEVSVRSNLLLVTIAAGLCEPVDADNETAMLIYGSDSEHPERAQCSAVFAENTLDAADRACLHRAVCALG